MKNTKANPFKLNSNQEQVEKQRNDTSFQQMISKVCIPTENGQVEDNKYIQKDKQNLFIASNRNDQTTSQKFQNTTSAYHLLQRSRSNELLKSSLETFIQSIEQFTKSGLNKLEEGKVEESIQLFEKQNRLIYNQRTEFQKFKSRGDYEWYKQLMMCKVNISVALKMKQEIKQSLSVLLDIYNLIQNVRIEHNTLEQYFLSDYKGSYDILLFQICEAFVSTNDLDGYEKYAVKCISYLENTFQECLSKINGYNLFLNVNNKMKSSLTSELQSPLMPFIPNGTDAFDKSNLNHLLLSHEASIKSLQIELEQIFTKKIILLQQCCEYLGNVYIRKLQLINAKIQYQKSLTIAKHFQNEKDIKKYEQMISQLDANRDNQDNKNDCEDNNISNNRVLYQSIILPHDPSLDPAEEQADHQFLLCKQQSSPNSSQIIRKGAEDINNELSKNLKLIKKNSQNISGNNSLKTSQIVESKETNEISDQQQKQQQQQFQLLQSMQIQNQNQPSTLQSFNSSNQNQQNSQQFQQNNYKNQNQYIQNSTNPNYINTDNTSINFIKQIDQLNLEDLIGNEEFDKQLDKYNQKIILENIDYSSSTITQQNIFKNNFFANNQAPINFTSKSTIQNLALNSRPNFESDVNSIRKISISSKDSKMNEMHFSKQQSPKMVLQIERPNSSVFSDIKANQTLYQSQRFKIKRGSLQIGASSIGSNILGKNLNRPSSTTKSSFVNNLFCDPNTIEKIKVTSQDKQSQQQVQSQIKEDQQITRSIKSPSKFQIQKSFSSHNNKIQQKQQIFNINQDKLQQLHKNQAIIKTETYETLKTQTDDQFNNQTLKKQQNTCNSTSITNNKLYNIRDFVPSTAFLKNKILNQNQKQNNASSQNSSFQILGVRQLKTEISQKQRQNRINKKESHTLQTQQTQITVLDTTSIGNDQIDLLSIQKREPNAFDNNQSTQPKIAIRQGQRRSPKNLQLDTNLINDSQIYLLNTMQSSGGQCSTVTSPKTYLSPQEINAMQNNEVLVSHKTSVGVKLVDSHQMSTTIEKYPQVTFSPQLVQLEEQTKILQLDWSYLEPSIPAKNKCAMSTDSTAIKDKIISATQQSETGISIFSLNQNLSQKKEQSPLILGYKRSQTAKQYLKNPIKDNFASAFSLHAQQQSRQIKNEEISRNSAKKLLTREGTLSFGSSPANSPSQIQQNQMYLSTNSSKVNNQDFLDMFVEDRVIGDDYQYGNLQKNQKTSGSVNSSKVYLTQQNLKVQQALEDANLDEKVRNQLIRNRQLRQLDTEISSNQGKGTKISAKDVVTGFKEIKNLIPSAKQFIQVDASFAFKINEDLTLLNRPKSSIIKNESKLPIFGSSCEETQDETLNKRKGRSSEKRNSGDMIQRKKDNSPSINKSSWVVQNSDEEKNPQFKIRKNRSQTTHKRGSKNNQSQFNRWSVSGNLLNQQNMKRQFNESQRVSQNIKQKNRDSLDFLHPLKMNQDQKSSTYSERDNYGRNQLSLTNSQRSIHTILTLESQKNQQRSMNKKKTNDSIGQQSRKLEFSQQNQYYVQNQSNNQGSQDNLLKIPGLQYSFSNQSNGHQLQTNSQSTHLKIERKTSSDSDNISQQKASINEQISKNNIQKQKAVCIATNFISSLITNNDSSNSLKLKKVSNEKFTSPKNKKDQVLNTMGSSQSSQNSTKKKKTEEDSGPSLTSMRVFKRLSKVELNNKQGQNNKRVLIDEINMFVILDKAARIIQQFYKKKYQKRSTVQRLSKFKTQVSSKTLVGISSPGKRESFKPSYNQLMLSVTSDSEDSYQNIKPEDVKGIKKCESNESYESGNNNVENEKPEILLQSQLGTDKFLQSLDFFRSQSQNNVQFLASDKIPIKGAVGMIQKLPFIPLSIFKTYKSYKLSKWHFHELRTNIRRCKQEQKTLFDLNFCLRMNNSRGFSNYINFSLKDVKLKKNNLQTFQTMNEFFHSMLLKYVELENPSFFRNLKKIDLVNYDDKFNLIDSNDGIQLLIDKKYSGLKSAYDLNQSQDKVSKLISITHKLVRLLLKMSIPKIKLIGESFTMTTDELQIQRNEIQNFNMQILRQYKNALQQQRRKLICSFNPIPTKKYTPPLSYPQMQTYEDLPFIPKIKPIQRKQSLFFYQDQGQREDQLLQLQQYQQSMHTDQDILQSEQSPTSNMLQNTSFHSRNNMSFHAVSKKDMKNINVESQMYRRRKRTDTFKQSSEDINQQRKDSISFLQNQSYNQFESEQDQDKQETNNILNDLKIELTKNSISQQKYLSKFHRSFNTLGNASSPQSNKNNKWSQPDTIQNQQEDNSNNQNCNFNTSPQSQGILNPKIFGKNAVLRNIQSETNAKIQVEAARAYQYPSNISIKEDVENFQQGNNQTFTQIAEQQQSSRMSFNLNKEHDLEKQNENIMSQVFEDREQQQKNESQSFVSQSEEKNSSRQNIPQNKKKSVQLDKTLDQFMSLDDKSPIRGKTQTEYVIDSEEKLLQRKQNLISENLLMNKSQTPESNQKLQEISDTSSRYSRQSIFTGCKDIYLFFSNLLTHFYKKLGSINTIRQTKQQNRSQKKIDYGDYFIDYDFPKDQRNKYQKIISSANPFCNNEILYKGLVKYKRNYLFCQVIFNYDEEIMDKYFQKLVVNNNSRFIIKFHGITPKNNNTWESQLTLSFKKFIRWFVGIESSEFSYQRFRDNIGFSKHQLDCIRKNINRLIYFEISEAKILYFQKDLREKSVQKKKQKYLLNRNVSYVAQQNLMYAALFDSSLQQLIDILKMENPSEDLKTNLSIMKSSTFIQDRRALRLYKRIQLLQQNSNIEQNLKISAGKKKIKSLIERKIVIVKESYEQAARDNLARYQEHQFDSELANNKYFTILRGYNTIYAKNDKKILVESKDYYFQIKIQEQKISDKLDIIQVEKLFMYVTTKNPFKQNKRIYFALTDPYLIDKVKNSFLFKSEFNEAQHKYIYDFLMKKLLKTIRVIHGIKEKIVSFYKKQLLQDALHSTFIEIFNQKTIELLTYFTFVDRQQINFQDKEHQDKMRGLANHLNLTLINQHINEVTENIKRTYFETLTTQFFFRIQNEKFIVESTAYRTKNNLNLMPLCYIVLSIYKYNKQKTSSFKLILNLTDIETVFKSKVSHDTIFYPNQLLQISQYVMKKVQKVPFDHYSRFVLPLKAFFPFSSDLKKLILINSFSVERNYFMDSKFYLSPLSSMRMEMNYMKVIYKGVSKVQGQFCILTIKQYQYLDYYQIQIYFPISARKYSTFIYDQNIRQFSDDFMHGILKYPCSIQSARYRNYLQFEEAISEEQIALSNNEESELIEPKIFCQQINPNLQKDSQMLYYMWNQIAQKIQVRKNQHNFQIFELNNYYSVLHEQIFDRVIRVHNNDSILFEVFLENQNKKQINKISDPFRNIDYVNTGQYVLFIKINFFNRINQYNEKINLQNTLYTFYTENISILLEDLKLLQKKKRQNLQYTIANQEDQDSMHQKIQDYDDPVLERENDTFFIRFRGNHQNQKDRYSLDEILNSLEITQSKIFDALTYISEKIQSNYQVLFMQEHSSAILRRTSTNMIQSLFSKSFSQLSMGKITPSGNRFINLARQLKQKGSILPENDFQSNDISLNNCSAITPLSSNPNSQQQISILQNQALVPSSYKETQQKLLRINYNNQNLYSNQFTNNMIIEENQSPIQFKSQGKYGNDHIKQQVSIPLVYTLQSGEQGQNLQSNSFQHTKESNLNLNILSGNNTPLAKNRSRIKSIEELNSNPQQSITQKALSGLASKKYFTKRSLAISVQDNFNLQHQVPQQQIQNNNRNVINSPANQQDDSSQIYSNNLKVIETNLIKMDKRYKPRIKTNSNLNMGIVENTLTKNYIILFRKLLTFKPLIFLSIIYYERNQTIIFSAQNLENCKEINKKYDLNQIEYVIPYASKMIESSLFQEVGDRLYLAYKNRIIVTVQSELN